MRKLLLSVSLAALFGTAMAQEDDPVVMRIAGKPVTRSEFEYNYNKNNQDSAYDAAGVAEYVELFINYKLKVKAAEDAHFDTLTSFRDEFRTYRDQQIRPLLVSAEAEEQEALAYYDRMLKQLNGHDLRLPAHIFLRVPQNSADSVQARQKMRIDSIYGALQAGEDFEELAKKFSEDPQTAPRGGALTWFGPGQLLPEFEQTMYALRKGEVSEPIQTAAGYHIVRLNDQKDLEPYDTLRSQILRFLEARGLRERLALAVVDTLASEGGITADEVLDRECERLCAEDTDLRYLVQEYHDGLLLYEICKQQVWDPAASDTAALQSYFKKNKKRYAWDKPHFYGMVYHTANKEDVGAVKKLLKGVDESQWTQTVKEAMNTDSVAVRMEMKLFAQGDNAFVDSLVFKVNTGKARPRKGFPYSGAVGRTLKKSPQKWTDVAGSVVSDYQMECDKQFAEELRKRYEVEVYKDVLETVNKH
ncbi:MAG: peptidyl-prolyl cis-trans isomerase [Prevotellaceae bacterium]|nr:peptidyl-prolyl cis-trans isomerase [Prevotellaceae bacterium]